MEPELARPAIHTTPSWHAVALLPHAEALAADQLVRQGFTVFGPTILRTVRHARQFRTRVAPLFPGYLFVRLDPAGTSWRSINGTRGVRGLVMTGERPARVPDAVIAALYQTRTEEDGLAPGVGVEILAGPFAGLRARLERLDGRDRVAVLMQLVGGAVRASLPRAVVRATD